ncbi:hypothetical protein MLD38_014049 [Melastoma candidum]|uniref:Uncharacterized protein n=1 Tax=Melastoma candidum TaxID=119954 RepID=A0ACB9RC41_9MYRT|nr:hypothetical protein MLD38_014049 [Melastoma candidum]
MRNGSGSGFSVPGRVGPASEVFTPRHRVPAILPPIWRGSGRATPIPQPTIAWRWVWLYYVVGKGRIFI